jgi:hypothetical protein
VCCSFAGSGTFGATGVLRPGAGAAEPESEAGGAMSPRASRSTGGGARPGQSVVSAAWGFTFGQLTTT